MLIMQEAAAAAAAANDPIVTQSLSVCRSIRPHTHNHTQPQLARYGMTGPRGEVLLEQRGQEDLTVR